MKNHLDAMKAQLLDLFQAKFRGKVAKSSWHRIPSVSDFDVIVGDVNELLQQININLKLPAEIKVTSTKINRCNRYMAHQIVRIRKAMKAENERLAWTIANSCVERSVSFRTSAVNKVLNNWFYKIPLWELTSIIKKVERIVRGKYTKMDFHRVYIPKANGKIRPLGVPTPEGRIVLHMINNMIQVLTEGKVGESQHGFIPGRGTMTAGMEILKKVLKAQYIYETDLKGFFDNISTGTIQEYMSKFDVGPVFSMWMFKINKSIPKFPKMLKMDESRFNIAKFPTRMNSKDGYFADKRMAKEYDESRPLIHVFEYLRGGRTQFPLVIGGDRKPDDLEYENGGVGPGGVPQGAPTSPYLSILPLNELYLSQQSHVNYADDQIFYGEQEFIIKDNPKRGIIHNDQKCGGIKRDGKGLKPLKFLGLEYDPFEDTLKTSTRSGASKTEVPENLRSLIKEISYDDENDFGEIISKRNFFGFIQSCLYAGNGDNRHRDTYEKLLEREGCVNPNSFLGRLAEGRTASSTAITLLMDEVIHRMKVDKTKRRVTPNPKL